MPELPEVETIARELQSSPLIGQEIRSSRILWPKTLARPTLSDFEHMVHGERLLAVGRRGKFLLLQLTHYTLLIHLRMTGKLSILPFDAPQDSHERARLIFDNGLALLFSDTRKFGRWYLVNRPEEILLSLGLEPLLATFTVASLRKILQHSQRSLKALLLDQRAIAGLGNIYVDEALWKACLHPKTSANSLTLKQCTILHNAIQEVLQQGIENMGTRLGSSKANYYSVYRKAGNEYALQVFRRHGQPCKRCQTTIVRIKVAQRSTHICPKCQSLS